MSGPVRPLPDPAARPGAAAAETRFAQPAPAPPSPGPALTRLALTRLTLAGAAIAALALAGGSWAGPAGAAAGAMAALAGALLLRLARLEAQSRAWQARARAADAARLQAEAESRAKSLFLAEMSHELRTPLNTVMGFSEMMAQEVLGPHRVPAYGGYARDIHASGRHLLALADDLLDLARIETGHRSLMETPVALDAMAGDCLSMMRPQAEARSLALSFEPAGIAPRLWGDERALRQIALNLLANAVKFTPAGGAVRLVAGIGAQGAPFLAVEDTGPGVTMGELPLGGAHPRESRLDLATGRGAGLGLAIVRGLAGLHGGELSLVRRPGGGTAARVVFPAARAL
ncbi:sensor histidine kinase [Xanthobacter sp. AM11]|uniref:sensor histidine kinase n=1 Tax=Xanthobacter sp. AM11 TaxID=3380643 RepID=UPI0039BF28A8